VDKEDDADKEGDLGFSTPYLETHDVTFDVRDWRKIEGQTIRNRDVAPWNPVGAGYKPAPMMAWRRAKIAKLNDATLFKQQGPTAYLYTPEPLRTSGDSIFFASRRGNLFTVEWECSAGVCWDVDHSSDLPLRLNTELAFNGVHIWWVKADGFWWCTCALCLCSLVRMHPSTHYMKTPPYHGEFSLVNLSHVAGLKRKSM